MVLRVGIDGRFLSDLYPGIGRYLFNLVRSLPSVASGEEFRVLTDPAAPNSRFDLAGLKHDCVRLTDCSVPLRSLSEQRVLPRWAHRAELTLFHTPFWWTAWRMPCPTVATIFDLIPMLDRSYLPSWWARWIYSLGIRLATRSARCILTLSRASRNHLTTHLGLDPAKIVVTYGAADPTFRPASQDEISTLRRRLDLGRPYVLYLGTMRPHKNLERLLEAWTEVAGSGLGEHELILAGPQDPRYPEARRLADGPGCLRARCLGPVAEMDLKALLSGAELLVSPSLWEGFGLPIVEAMACGVPVACSNASALAEVAGEAALLFDPRDTPAIARAIERALGDPELCRRLVRRGFARSAELSWQETARQTLAAYRQAASHGAGG